MKIKDGFILREVLGKTVVVAVGKRVKEFNGIINLNSSSAFLWKALSEDVTEEQLVQKLLEEYQVEEDVARRDVSLFVEKLKEAKLIEL